MADALASCKRATVVETKSPAPSIPLADLKLSYTVKEVCKLVDLA